MSTVANDPIRAYIVNEFLAGEDAEDLTDDFDLIESTVVNSLGLVRLISWISETYSIPVDDIPLEAGRLPHARGHPRLRQPGRPGRRLTALPLSTTSPTSPTAQRPNEPHAPTNPTSTETPTRIAAAAHTSRKQR